MLCKFSPLPDCILCRIQVKWKHKIFTEKEEKLMITVAYIGFGVSVREYHIPYVENREDIKVKYVYRREEDIAAFAE